MNATSAQSLNYLPRLPRDKSVGIGCIGAGFIMADCQLVAYRQAGFNPVAIAARRPDQAEEVARRHQIPLVFTDYREMLKRPEVQVVDIAVPPDIQIFRTYSRCAGAEAAGYELF
jgi:glutamyl-tRNA reductase